MFAHAGLLSRGDNGGFFAPVLSKRDLEEIIEVRMAMELGAVRLLALKDSVPQRLEDLRAVCLTMEQALEANLDLGFEEADRRFHEVLVDLADNARLSNVYQHAPLPVLPSNELDEEARRKSRLKTQDEHRRICDLLETKDYKRVAELLEQHLMTSYHILPIVM
jgi:DNA-binding GntR family transcriptional regulator